MTLGRTPAEAVNNYIESLQTPVSCISNSIVTVRGGYYVSDRSHILDLNNGHPVRLAGTSRLWIAFRQYYRIVESGAPDRLYSPPSDLGPNGSGMNGPSLTPRKPRIPLSIAASSISFRL